MQQAVNYGTVVLLTIVLLTTIATSQWIDKLQEYILEDSHKTSSLFTNNVPYETFDFIVIGAGTSGSVIASRLTENPYATVLLLEAGEEENFSNEIPLAASTLQATKYNWNYTLEPQDNMCYGIADRKCPWPRGKALGGTSAINYMIYTRGNRRDYDNWEELGNPGWSYHDVLPYFLKSEQSHLKNVDEEYHYKYGLQSVDTPKFEDPVTDAFLKAAEQFGYKTLDYNGESQMGFSKIQATIQDGRRVSAASAFLYPFITRKNLHILKSCFVTKILINENKRAYGVRYTWNSENYSVYASKEVILSAGVIGSPQLLMLSGIGPAKDLERLGINVVQDLAVGETLYDHIVFGVKYIHNATTDNALNFANFWKWLRNGTGIFASPVGTTAVGFISTNNSSYPNIELILASGVDELYNQKLNEKSRYKTPSFGVASEVTHPKHVGCLKLRSKNPYDHPIIDANYLSDPEDLQVHLSAIRFIQELTQTEPFKRINAQMYKAPVPGCEKEEFNSDAYWICAVKHMATTSYHPCGTCKMGPRNDPKAVVDNQLKVYGVQSLRVADSSIFPKIITGHTNAPSLMVGEKAADLIRNEWF